MITVANSLTSSASPFLNGYDFRSSLISSQSKPIVISLSKAKSIERKKISPRFKIEFSDFDYKFNFEITDIKGELSANEVVLYLKFDENVIKVVLSGNRQTSEGLYINNFGFGVETQGQTPISVFLLKSLWTMLGLSKEIKIQIPDLNQKATMSFNANLNSISELLQVRQIAYRLMIIEKTFKIRLPCPQYINGEEVENLAYCFHSVVDRKFEWVSSPAIIPWFATPTYLSILPEKNVPFSMQYGPELFAKEVFGYPINLGLQIAKIEEYILDNFDEVKNKLSKLDGSEVLIRARSKNGVMQIESLTTATLPKNAFSKDIQKLIDLEGKFDLLYFDKYLNSFSNAFENLTDEQIQAITERPALEEEAFGF